MSLHSHVIEPVPEDTARVARAAFPTGHPYLTFRDALGSIFQDEDCTALFPAWGQPALSPWRLEFGTIRPFRENRSDRQARQALPSAIVYRYVLCSGIFDPRFSSF